MVFKCPLVYRNLFQNNYSKIKQILTEECSNFKLLYERDTMFDKCKHAIKIIL
jgi:hypothetical protein